AGHPAIQGLSSGRFHAVRLQCAAAQSTSGWIDTTFGRLPPRHLAYYASPTSWMWLCPAIRWGFASALDDYLLTYYKGIICFIEDGINNHEPQGRLAISRIKRRQRCCSLCSPAGAVCAPQQNSDMPRPL